MNSIIQGGNFMAHEHIHTNRYASAAAGELGFLAGAKDCIPTILGYLSIGFAAGVVEKTAGLSIAEIALMSLLLYAGSAQFIFAGMFAAGSPIFSIIFTVFFVNIRHLLLSAALSPYFRKYSPLRNTLIGAELTDETFGVAINRLTNHTANNDKWMLGLNVTAHVNWLAANIAGGYLGAWIPSPERYGLDFALPAMFIGLLVLQVAGRKNLGRDMLIIAAAAAVFMGLNVWISGYAAVMAATVIAACIGMVTEKWK
jgi:4-azaleucine resistance transporter AzlC